MSTNHLIQQFNKFTGASQKRCRDTGQQRTAAKGYPPLKTAEDESFESEAEISVKECKEAGRMMGPTFLGS